MLGEWTETDSATLNYEILTTWETKPWTNPQKTSGLLNGTGTGHPARYMTMMNPVQILVPQFFRYNNRPSLARGKPNFYSKTTKSVAKSLKKEEHLN